MADMLGIDRRADKNNPQYNLLKKGIIPSEPTRYKILRGTLVHKEKGVETGEFSQMYDRSRYKFFLDAPFEISSMCCKIMKKRPMHSYAKKTGRKPITAQMASESRVRTQQWLKNGCNGFDMKSPVSNPMSFWTEQDVLAYIDVFGTEMVKNKINSSKVYMKYGDRFVSRETGATINNAEIDRPICSVYGEIVKDYAAQGQIDGQINLSDIGIFDTDRPLLKTTGCSRTGCMFCGYGCHLEKFPGRFERMKTTHPKQYEYIMRGGHWKYRVFNFKGEEICLRHCSQEQIEKWVESNRDNPRFKIEKGDFFLDGTGLGYREVIDWINENGNMNIKY